ncbi:MAG: tyrosine-type recombinase/integrase [Dehalococcoidia bacterium]
MATFADLADTYLTACKAEGKAQRTISAYRQSINVWRRIAGELEFPAEINEITVHHVYQFLGVVQERGAGRGYQHRLHVELRTFFSWCVRMELLNGNVLARVPNVKREQTIIQPFSPQEVISLLRAGAATQRTSARNSALILFLLDTGVRVSECIQVCLDDVDWENGRVRILHGKGRKQRWVGLGERAVRALRRYVDDVRGIEQGALFLSTYSRRQMQVFAVNTLLTRLGVLAGVTKVHPHRFRHTFATWALRSNAREIDVQNLLGHSSMGMTQRYARTYSSDQAVLAHHRFSPALLLPSE